MAAFKSVYTLNNSEHGFNRNGKANQCIHLGVKSNVIDAGRDLI